ncbi:hypothetical protein PLESTM_000178500 [Pleodorina starrii]|nr:hypothetical protein PLESTM_000178500 [Pleodorina starrii]
MAPWTPYALSRATTDVSWRPHKPAKRRRAASDELKLFCMGYKQELTRSFTLFNNAGVAFSLLSPLASLTGMYGSWGLLYGGPVVMMWGMPVVTLFSLLVAISLAELASAYPTSGAIYYWSWALAPPRLKAVASWVSGWVLVLGQASFTASSCRIFTDMLAAFVLMATGQELSSGAQLGVFLAVFAACAALASSPNAVMAYVTSLTAFWNLIALAALAAALPALAPRRQALSYVYTRWQDNGSVTGVHSHVYNMLLGLLMSQYLYLGFDACAHISEETQHADVNAPRGMMAAVAATSLCGYLYLLALNLAAVDPATLLAPDNESRGGHAVAQLFWNVHKAAYGNGRGGLALLTIPMVAALMCTHQCIAANARMLFAFSRDGAVPLHRFTARVERRTRAPIAAVWVMAALAALIGAPMYFAGPYVSTIDTMAVVNTYLSYGVPLLCKLLSGRGVFLPGPFYTGPRASRLINALALGWIAAIAVIFSLPTVYPIKAVNMNYNAGGTVLAILASLGAFYCPVIGGRHWFTGPRPNLGQFDDTAAPVLQQQGTTALEQQQQQQQELPRKSSSQRVVSVPRTDTGDGGGGGGGGEGGCLGGLSALDTATALDQEQQQQQRQQEGEGQRQQRRQGAGERFGAGAAGGAVAEQDGDGEDQNRPLLQRGTPSPVAAPVLIPADTGAREEAAAAAAAAVAVATAAGSSHPWRLLQQQEQQQQQARRQQGGQQGGWSSGSSGGSNGGRLRSREPLLADGAEGAGSGAAGRR